MACNGVPTSQAHRNMDIYRMKVKKMLLLRGVLRKYTYIFFALAKNDYFCMRLFI